MSQRPGIGPSRNPGSAVDNAPEWTVEALENVLVKCIQTGDAEGIQAALTLMALKDPHRAELLLKTIEVGIAMRQETS